MDSSRTAEFDSTKTPTSPLPARVSLVASLFALVMVAAACGSAATSDGGLAKSGDGTGDEVATIEDPIVASVGEEDDAAETTPEEAGLAFSQCMRDEGLDFPDLVVDAGGNINLRDGFDAVDRTDESFREARDACQDELAAGGFGGGRRAALESPEVQDGLGAEPIGEATR